jgi:DNA-binding Lrp family transcriptional regulator
MTPTSEISREWTFLSNHGHILIHLSRYPDSRIRDIADTVGITERSAQAILADLEETGYVTITRIGIDSAVSRLIASRFCRRNNNKYNSFKSEETKHPSSISNKGRSVGGRTGRNFKKRFEIANS